MQETPVYGNAYRMRIALREIYETSISKKTRPSFSLDDAQPLDADEGLCAACARVL
ncbi:hypothetical protein TAMA11512_17410 [Selenomonas sp. TAMA-11512]|nr:hypothetical protein TAMA11512_17410 [Selenomonas sp. TAMA-11512]